MAIWCGNYHWNRNIVHTFPLPVLLHIRFPMTKPKISTLKSNIIMKWQRFPCINALRGYVLICTVCVCAHIICCDNNVKQRRILFYVNWYLQHYCWGSRLKMVIVLLTYAYTWLIAYRCNPRRIITQATATAAILASVKCLSCLNKQWCNYHLSVTLSTSDYRAQIQKSCRQIWYIPTTSPMGILY